MNPQKEIANLQGEFENKQKVLKDLALIIKRQGRRKSSIVALYKSQQKSDGVFSKIPLQDPTFKDLEDYFDLLSKQFSVRFEDMIKELHGTKHSIQVLSSDIKKRPNEDYSIRFDQIRKVLQEVNYKFQLVWSEEHFLALNYRLDIAAKELQRWNMVMQANTSTPESIQAVVNNLFQ